jgi:ubiquinone/menaquinone biosynthesis C-methylase UbiE
MSAASSASSDNPTAPRERYRHGSDPDEQRRLEQRTGANAAGFFLPHLRPGMRLLDVGCGPGSITLDLAEIVAPGELVGIDFQEPQVVRARELAASRNIATARFEVGDAYALPFPDASFDAVFAHTLLNHLRDPLRALREMHRVLRPGGVCGVCDHVNETLVLEPATALLEQMSALLLRVMNHNTGQPAEMRPRHFRRLLLEAGFTRAEVTPIGRGFGTPAETRRRAADLSLALSQPSFGGVALSQGWADRETLEAMRAAVLEWGERPDALFAWLWLGAVGWKDGAAAEAAPVDHP